MIMTFQVLPKKNESPQELEERIRANYPGGLITLGEKGFLEVVHFHDLRYKEGARAVWTENSKNHCLRVLFKEPYLGHEDCFGKLAENGDILLTASGMKIGKISLPMLQQLALVIAVCEIKTIEQAA